MVWMWLVACRLNVPPAPALDDTWTWQVEREALPSGALRVVHTSTVSAKEKLQVEGGGNEVLKGPVSAYLLTHPTGPLLIDVGLGDRDYLDYPGRRAVKLLSLSRLDTVADRLPDVGLSASDIDTILITHLHYDHAGALDAFPDATVWADEREWTAGTKKRALSGYFPAPYAEREAQHPRWQGSGPYGPFPAHHDLLGDGSVILLPASGHTVGSMMVLVNLAEGSWLFTGDVAWLDVHWQEARPKGTLASLIVEDDWKLNLHVLHQIRAFVDRYPEITVIAGHEPANLERLSWPEPFSKQ